ncbi:sal-like protein 4 [Sardina pilchardus]|uniref:sal-like protein 4 n=1 Tax=Sardina pilchardus TaxID=27697 RepID=UPI002E0DF247
MSRRKQSKPQHINSEEPGSIENGALQDGPGEDEERNEVKRCRMEETRVCNKCCAEFFDETEFMEHQQSCTKSQEVVIMKDGGGEEALPEFSHGSSHDFQNGHHSHEESQADPQSTVGEDEEMEDEQLAKLSTGEEFLTPSQAKMSSTADAGHPPSSKHQDSNNVTLESMPATKVAVTQHSSSSTNSSSSLSSCKSLSSQDLATAAAHAIPMILEQLVSLQQQQLQQIQLTEQIRIQVAMMTPQGLNGAVGAALDPLKALGAHLSQQLSAAAALIGKRTGSQSLSLETLKQSKLPQTNGLPTSLATGLGSMTTKTDLLKGLPDLTSRLPNLLPQSPGALAFPSPFNALAGAGAGLDSSKKGSSKTTGLPSEVKNGSGDHTFKHKCKYCGKIFGNDSALQIHLRSHTGERPFKCNICGNRFTTKGNLKVHFQRHRDKYPHIKMNPHPVPEHLDNIPTSSGIPYGMSLPIEESNFVDVKPAIGMSASGFPSSAPQGYKPFDVSADPYSQRPSSSGSDGTSIHSSMYQQEMGMEQTPESMETLVGLQHMNGKVPSGDGLGTAKLQQMVDGLEKRTNDPNECVICHRILSCQSSLKMHYRTHTGERPYKCKICGRAFSTKGNLKAHYGVHRSNTPLKMQHSCPICQKKFTNAVVLQQHIRMHMGGQIPNTPVPETQFDGPESMDSSLTEDKSVIDGMTNNLQDSLEEHDSEMEPQEKAAIMTSEPIVHHGPSDASRDETPTLHGPSPILEFTGIAALENHMKSLTAALNLQRQSSTASDSDGGLKDSPSTYTPHAEQDYKNGRSPAVSDSVSFHSSSPVDSHPGSNQSKSPESASVDATSKLDSDGGQQDFSDGALDLTSSSFVPKPIKEEPGLPYSNGEFAPNHMSYMRVPPSLVKLEMQIPPETAMGAHGLFQGAGIQPPTSSASRRSTKLHLCNSCGKNFSSASALQIHERTHTGEKPFACTICGRAFTTKGNLKVHVGTHMWNNSARRGQRLSLDNPMALIAMGSEAKMLPDMIQPPKDLVPPPMNFDPSVWNKYAAAFTNGLTMKTNEISVIQNGGIPLPGTLAGGSLVASTGAMMKMDGSQTGLSAAMAEMEKNGSESVSKAQFPHFMEEGKIAVN